MYRSPNPRPCDSLLLFGMFISQTLFALSYVLAFYSIVGVINSTLTIFSVA
jgi:hypothetical protein